ncbi:MAG: DUF1003 domain-containing protein [Proteobacteria bacterium]|nr:DUF1003 domain-containing protein [Pseudomonadota bacterium]
MSIQDQDRGLPVHIEQTVSAIASLHEQHRADAAPIQQVVEGVTRFVARPRFAGFVAAFLLAWAVVNLALPHLGLKAFDPWPYEGLQGIASVGALFLTVFILITERRENELSDLREQLTLQLAISAEQKSAKVIRLLEELRQDLPNVRDRADPEAQDLANPADPQAVFDALKQSQEDGEASA